MEKTWNVSHLTAFPVSAATADIIEPVIDSQPRPRCIIQGPVIHRANIILSVHFSACDGKWTFSRKGEMCPRLCNNVVI